MDLPATQLASVIDAAIDAFGGGRWEEARRGCRWALAAVPGHGTGLLLLGAATARLGARAAGRTYLARAAVAAPDASEVHNTIGNLLSEDGDGQAAISSYRRALCLAPAHAAVLYNLGSALLGPTNAEAGRWLKRSVDVHPSFADAWANLAMSGGVPGRAGMAAKIALALDPAHPVAWIAKGLFGLGRLDPHSAVVANQRALAADRDNRAAWTNLLTAIHYDPRLDSGQVFARIRAWGRRIEAMVAPVPATPSPDPERRLRIGYLSADLRSHVVAANVMGLIAHHDPAGFEIFFYAEVREPDDTSRWFAGHGTWRSIVGLSDAEAAALIRADGVDILVCLAGHTAGNRLAIAAHRPAPVQLSFHDLSTSGLERMDGWLTDRVLHPEGTRELFTETLLRLPCFYLQSPPVPSPEPTPPPLGGTITWGCFNSPAKLSDVVFDAWARILAATPGSRLMLAYRDRFADAALADHVAGRLARLDVARERLIVSTDILSREAHLSRVAAADIALDAFPFGGSTTTFESLWMGVPVVTLAGERFVGRVGASMLTAIGETGLIADSVEAYVATAVALAGDRGRITRLRAELRGRLLDSPLLDAPAYARSVEGLYRQAWRRWCARPRG